MNNLMDQKAFSRPLLSVFISIFVAFLASCAIIKPSAPEINLASIKVTDITLTNVEFVARLKVYNPNNTAITINEVDYELKMCGVKVSRGRSIEAVKIGALETGQVDMRLSSSYLDLIKVLGGVQNGANAAFIFEGEVKYSILGLSNLIYRFKKKGTLPVSLSDKE
ncbi:MAG: LEA type 2 family protein [Dissulfurimicrobium sp.]|uniref:LEA type 2 family protein n=1 Tax=Dissulfurimicrobium sp. TaxID=2022436 RepID=UPI00404B8BCC